MQSRVYHDPSTAIRIEDDLLLFLSGSPGVVIEGKKLPSSVTLEERRSLRRRPFCSPMDLQPRSPARAQSRASRIHPILSRECPFSANPFVTLSISLPK